MTDKQIIIDGCPYQGECSVSGCKRNDDGCFVKQLFEERNRAENQIVDLNKMVEAKEQECEELKETLSQYETDLSTKDCIVETCKAQYKELKAENEILKEKFEIAIKNNMDKTLLRLENGDVKEELQEIREEFGIETLYCHDDNTRVHRCLDVLRLKNVLTEIKEIAENVQSFVDWNLEDDVYTEMNKILQKISECEVEE